MMTTSATPETLSWMCSPCSIRNDNKFTQCAMCSKIKESPMERISSLPSTSNHNWAPPSPKQAHDSDESSDYEKPPPAEALMRGLEAAVVRGDAIAATEIAKKLADQKVPLTVKRKCVPDEMENGGKHLRKKLKANGEDDQTPVDFIVIDDTDSETDRVIPVEHPVLPIPDTDVQEINGDQNQEPEPFNPEPQQNSSNPNRPFQMSPTWDDVVAFSPPPDPMDGLFDSDSSQSDDDDEQAPDIPAEPINIFNQINAGLSQFPPVLPQFPRVELQLSDPASATRRGLDEFEQHFQRLRDAMNAVPQVQEPNLPQFPPQGFFRPYVFEPPLHAGVQQNPLPAGPPWNCQYCTLLNPAKNTHCSVCLNANNVRNVQPPAMQPPPNVISVKKPTNSSPNTSRSIMSRKKKHLPRIRAKNTYEELQNIDSTGYVANTQKFDCPICFTEIPRGKGVILRDCLHTFCTDCLEGTVEHSETPQVKCPFVADSYTCESIVQDREIKSFAKKLVYEKYLQKSIRLAENQIENSFHCKTPDCAGWCEYDDNVNEFPCPACKKVNCLTCRAVHAGFNCQQYQEFLNANKDKDENSMKTMQLLQSELINGQAMRCPKCQVILMKKIGCDWLMCSMCRTEICWVTKGPRWGPGGKGDISGGCKCKVNNKLCHPNCRHCH